LLFSGVCPTCDDDGDDEGSEVDESDAGHWFDSAAGLTVNTFPFPEEDEAEWVDDSASEASDELLEYSDSGEEKEPDQKCFRDLGSRRVRSEAVPVVAPPVAPPLPDALPAPAAPPLPVAAAAPPKPVADPPPFNSNSASRRLPPSRGRGRLR
jgi:hypothetical protein